jgi:hypothetical protein
MASPKKAKASKKSKPTELPHSARELIRHAYEQLVTRAARLSSFASSTVLPGWSDVTERQEQLALDDLITFAIYTRRAVENSGRHKEFHQATMNVFYGADPKPISIMEVVNIVIHHRFIYLFRRGSDFKSSVLQQGGDMAEWMESYRKGIIPAVAIKSGGDNMIGFRISVFLDAVMGEIVEPLVDHCSEHGFYLEHLDQD